MGGGESPLCKQPVSSQVIENCPVTGIRVRTDDFGVRRVAAVETQHGSIQTPCVVNCAGGRVCCWPPLGWPGLRPARRPCHRPLMGRPGRCLQG